MIYGNAAQVIGAGSSDVTVILTDADAKVLMTTTPSVTLTPGYTVYEVNPTVVPNVYVARLAKPLARAIAKGDSMTFEV